MKIQLKQLILFNFRSYLGKHVIEFPESGLVLIDGPCSGSGKTTILSAISFVLEFPDHSNKDSQSWHNDESLYVELILMVDNEELFIHKGDKFWFTYKNETFSGGSKKVSNDLALILKLSPSIRKALSYRPQRTPGMFLSMTDSDKKEFLTQLLNINWIEVEIDKINKSITQLEGDVNTYNTIVDKCKNDVIESKVIKPDIKIDFILNIIDTLNNDNKKIELQINSFDKEIKKFENELNINLSKIDLDYKDQIDQLKQKDASEILNNLIKQYKEVELTLKNLKFKKEQDEDIYSQNIKEKESEINNLKEQTNILKQLEEKKEELIKENIKLEQQDCPKCFQKWNNAIDLLEQNIININNLENEIQLIKNQINELSKLQTNFCIYKDNYKIIFKSIDLDIEKNIDDLSKIKEKIIIENNNTILKQNNELLKIKNKKNESELQLQQEFKNEINSINIAKNKLIDIYSNNKDKLNELKSQKQTYDFQLSSYNEQLARINQKIKELESNEYKLKTINNQLNIEKDCKNLLKGFLDNIFEEIMQELGQETNNILLHLSNVNHISINFNIDKKTLKGETKFIINPIAYFGGIERPLISGSSGGMLTSVELAVDLALSNIISKRSGVDFNFMMFDESLNGLDSSSKEGALEVFSKYGNNKLFLIIDHAIELKENFEKIIEVKYCNGISSVA